MTHWQLRRMLWRQRLKLAAAMIATLGPGAALVGGAQRLGGVQMWEATVGSFLLYGVGVAVGALGLWFLVMLAVTFVVARDVFRRAAFRRQSDMSDYLPRLRREGAIGPIRWPF